LYDGEVCAEECDCGDADLVEAHDAPWALDDDEAVSVAGSMEVVEQLVFGQPWREIPLSAVSDSLWIEPSSGIAQGPRSRVAESDADGLVEEARTSVESSLETTCGLWMDRLVAEKIGPGVEWKPPAEGGEGLRGSSDGLDGRTRWVGIAGQRAEVVGDLPIGASIESVDEIDDVAAGVTSGETAPEVLATRDDESPWIVAAVDRAETAERVCLPSHSREQAAMGEDLLDGNESLETAEAQVSWDHVGLAWVFPVSVSAPAVRVCGKGKRETHEVGSW